MLAEPVGRNTAAAIGLAAIHLAHEHGDALMAVLPSDRTSREAAALPRTRFGGTRTGAHARRTSGAWHSANAARDRLRLHRARRKLRRGRSAFGLRGEALRRKAGAAAGAKIRRFGQILLECRHVFLACLDVSRRRCERFLPETHAALIELGKTIGTPRYASALRRIYPPWKISRSTTPSWSRPRVRGSSSQVFVIPTKVGWSDIGSWAAVYELLARQAAARMFRPGALSHWTREGNYFWSPKKFVAAIGVRDLVVVETDDALLVCARERSQDVGKIVKWLEEQKAQAPAVARKRGERDLSNRDESGNAAAKSNSARTAGAA